MPAIPNQIRVEGDFTVFFFDEEDSVRSIKFLLYFVQTKKPCPIIIPAHRSWVGLFVEFFTAQWDLGILMDAHCQSFRNVRLTREPIAFFDLAIRCSH
jgi:hypothetical protein